MLIVVYLFVLLLLLLLCSRFMSRFLKSFRRFFRFLIHPISSVIMFCVELFSFNISRVYFVPHPINRTIDFHTLFMLTTMTTTISRQRTLGRISFRVFVVFFFFCACVFILSTTCWLFGNISEVCDAKTLGKSIKNLRSIFFLLFDFDFLSLFCIERVVRNGGKETQREVVALGIILIATVEKIFGLSFTQSFGPISVFNLAQTMFSVPFSFFSTLSALLHIEMVVNC